MSDCAGYFCVPCTLVYSCVNVHAVVGARKKNVGSKCWLSLETGIYRA